MATRTGRPGQRAAVPEERTGAGRVVVGGLHPQGLPFRILASALPGDDPSHGPGR